MQNDDSAPPDRTNPILDKQIQDQQAEIEQKRQQLSAERLGIIKSRQQSWEPGSINDLNSATSRVAKNTDPAKMLIDRAKGLIGGGE